MKIVIKLNDAAAKKVKAAAERVGYKPTEDGTAEWVMDWLAETVTNIEAGAKAGNEQERRAADRRKAFGPNKAERDREAEERKAKRGKG